MKNNLHSNDGLAILYIGFPSGFLIFTWYQKVLTLYAGICSGKVAESILIKNIIFQPFQHLIAIHTWAYKDKSWG